MKNYQLSICDNSTSHCVLLHNNIVYKNWERKKTEKDSFEARQGDLPFNVQITLTFFNIRDGSCLGPNTYSFCPFRTVPLKTRANATNTKSDSSFFSASFSGRGTAIKIKQSHWYVTFVQYIQWTTWTKKIICDRC